MKKKMKIILGMSIILGAIGGAGYVRSAFAEVAVVVNKANPAITVTKNALERYFLKKTTMWDSDIKIEPVDLPVTDPVREEFSRTILGRTPRVVESHWIAQSLAGGKSAPEVVNNSALVKKYVAAEPGAIGYINISDLDDSVKRVEVMD